MAELKKTSTYGKKKQHYHIAYFFNDIEGITSTNDDHSHKIINIPSQSPVFDTINPEIQINPAVIGGWQVQESDNHTHLIEDYIPKPKSLEKKSDEEIISDALEIIGEIDKIEEPSIVKAEESFDMYCNNQWPEQLKSELESKDRAAVTANKMEQKHDILVGYQTQNRTEPKFYPVEGGDAITADILQYLFKDIFENCNYQKEKSKSFSDTIKVGRGLFNIYEDYTKDIRGEIVIERFPWRQAGFNSHNKEDLSDCESMYKYKWYSKENVKAMYPDIVITESDNRKNKTGKVYDKLDDKYIHSEYFQSKNGKNVKVIELWRKIFERSYILVNSNDNFVYNSYGWKDSDINSVLTIPGFYKIPRVNEKYRVTLFTENVLFEDSYVNEKFYPLVPVYAKKEDDNFWGKLETVKDMQVMINKSWSLFIDILNKIAGYFWIIDSNTFDNINEENNFKNNSSASGGVFKIADINRPPIKQEGVKFPVEIVKAIELFNYELREIMNIDLSMLGLGSENSGVLLKQKIAQQLIGNDYIFDNLSFAEKQVCRIVINKIKKIYTPDRIYRIIENLNNRDINNPIQIAGKPLTEYPPEEIMKILEVSDWEKHDTIISESAESPSVMMTSYLSLIDMAGRGAQIPQELFMELAPIPEAIKNKVRNGMMIQSKQEMDMENKKYDTEIQKTVLSKTLGQKGG